MQVARTDTETGGLEVLAMADGYLVRPEGREGAGLVFRTAPCALAYLDLLDREIEARRFVGPDRSGHDDELAARRSRLNDLCGRLVDTGTPASAIAAHEGADARRRAPRCH